SYAREGQAPAGSDRGAGESISGRPRAEGDDVVQGRRDRRGLYVYEVPASELLLERHPASFLIDQPANFLLEGSIAAVSKAADTRSQLIVERELHPLQSRGLLAHDLFSLGSAAFAPFAAFWRDSIEASSRSSVATTRSLPLS